MLFSRIFNIAIHMEGYNMINLFSADPRNYKFASQGDNRRVIDKNKVEPSFFTVGRVTFSSLNDGLYGHEINVQPLARTWPRQHAMLTQLLEMNNLIVSSYKGGIQYSTARKPATGSCLKPLSIT